MFLHVHIISVSLAELLSDQDVIVNKVHTACYDSAAAL